MPTDNGDGLASYLRGPLPLGVRRAGLHRLPLPRLPSVWPQGRPQMPRYGVVAQGKVSAGLRKKPQQGRVYAACGPQLLRLRRLRPPIRGRFVGRHPVRCRGFKSRTPLHFLFLLSKTAKREDAWRRDRPHLCWSGATVARLPCNQTVVGSIPSFSSKTQASVEAREVKFRFPRPARSRLLSGKKGRWLTKRRGAASTKPDSVVSSPVDW